MGSVERGIEIREGGEEKSEGRENRRGIIRSVQGDEEVKNRKRRKKLERRNTTENLP